MDTPDSPSYDLCPRCGLEPEQHYGGDFANCKVEPAKCACFEYVGDNPYCPVHGEASK